MSISRLRSHGGFTRTPFGKDLAPSMLHRHPGHAEAVARIAWCLAEAAIGLVTGEVGAGKTVAVRAAVGELDGSRHTVIYLGNPAIGARGLYAAIVARLGGCRGSTRLPSSPRPATPWLPSSPSGGAASFSWSTRPICWPPTSSRNCAC